MTSSFDHLIKVLLETDLSIQDFIRWYENEDLDEVPKVLLDALNRNHLEALKPELTLSLLNYIRDQTVTILELSQNCSQTPSKANHPSKYDYNSPIKSMVEKQKSSRPKNRVQLFASPIKNINNKDDSEGVVEIKDDLLIQKLVEQTLSDHKLASLESRVQDANKPSSVALKLNGNGTPKLNSGGKNKSSRTSPAALTLDDFVIIKPAKSKKGKKKNRKSVEQHQKEQNGAKMTPQDKSKYDKSDVWQQIVHSIDARDEEKSKTKQQEEKKTIPISSPLKKTEEDDLLVVEPLLQSVQFKDQLDKLAGLYTYCLDNHLVPNLLVELYLVLELLTVKHYLSNTSPTKSIGGLKQYFSTVHNCVYFASTVLKRQMHLLESMDRVTLVYLVENPRLDSFCPDVKAKLQAILDKKRLHRRHNSSGNNKELLTSVRFQSETDNRDTFPNNQTFQDFKRQRDLFYELLRDWKSGPNNSAFSSRVTGLLTLQDHPVNMAHFSKLFQEQLLAVALGESAYSDDDASNNEEANNVTADLQLLSEYKNKMDPTKWRKLQERLVMRSQFGGPCPGPNFSGCQEFFRDFIKVGGGNQRFLTHLSDCFTATIVDMNDRVFPLDHQDNLPDINGDTSGPSNALKNELGATILGLRVLAKFLAFVDMLPYQCRPESMTAEVAKDQLKLRRKYVPSLDLVKMIKESYRQQRMVVTLPWVIEFCSMLDPVSVQLPFYQRVFALLVETYRTYLRTFRLREQQQVLLSKPKGKRGIILDSETLSEHSDAEDVLTASLRKTPTVDSHTAFFLCIHIGWFFESPIFPRDLFVVQGSLINSSEGLGNKPVMRSKFALDETPCLLNQSLLYTCCPYLSELKVILSQFHSGFKAPKLVTTDHKQRKDNLMANNNKMQQKKKTKTKEEVLHAKMDMQDALEANFFHNQPASVKQTVEILTERLTSNVIRIIINEIVPQETEVVVKELNANMDSCLLGVYYDDKLAIKTVKEELLLVLNDMAGKSYEVVKDKTVALIKNQISAKVAAALTALLPDDTKDITKNMCTKIIGRRVMRQGKQWMGHHVSKGYFRGEYTREFEKVWGEKIKPDGALRQSAIVVHINLEQIPTPACDLLIKLKAQTTALFKRQNVTISSKEALLLFEQLEESLAFEYLEPLCVDKSSSADLSMKGFESLSVEWAITILAFSPATMSAEVQDKLVSLWGAHASKNTCKFRLAHPPCQLSTFLSPRNIELLGKSNTPNATWDKMEAFMGRLLKGSLFLPIALEDQCLSVLKREWPTDLLRRLGSCLKGIIESWKITVGTSTSDEDLFNFTQEFLDWFAWIFANMACDELDDNLDNFPALM